MSALKISVINSKAVKLLAEFGWEPEEHFGEKVNRFVNKKYPSETIEVFPSGSGRPIYFRHTFEGNKMSGLKHRLLDMNQREDIGL